jgi:hypothetical protein
MCRAPFLRAGVGVGQAHGRGRRGGGQSETSPFTSSVIRGGRPSFPRATVMNC